MYVCTFAALNEASDPPHLTPQLVPFETAMMNLRPNAEAESESTSNSRNDLFSESTSNIS